MKIRWSPRALERVVEIGEWIAADDPDAATRVVDGLFSAVERLAKFPGGGRIVPEFARPELREIIPREFRIMYRVGAQQIDILTVRHSLQLMDEADLTE